MSGKKTNPQSKIRPQKGCDFIFSTKIGFISVYEPTIKIKI
jgi:hypothetical protein